MYPGGSAVWRSDLANVRLISRALLDPSQSLHVLTVVASDGVFSATATVTLTIDSEFAEHIAIIDSLITVMY